MVQRNSDTSVDKLGHLLRSFTAPLMYLCRVVTLRYCMDVTVPFDPGAAGLVLVQASPELTSNMSFPFYKPVWTSTESLYLHSLYLYSRFLYSIHHSQSSQSISIYDRGIGAKISVSISISRFLRLENLLYCNSASEKRSGHGGQRVGKRQFIVRPESHPDARATRHVRLTYSYTDGQNLTQIENKTC